VSLSSSAQQLPTLVDTVSLHDSDATERQVQDLNKMVGLGLAPRHLSHSMPHQQFQQQQQQQHQPEHYSNSTSMIPLPGRMARSMNALPSSVSGINMSLSSPSMMLDNNNNSDTTSPQDMIVRLFSSLAASASTGSDVSCTNGVKSFHNLPGVELYLYNVNSNVHCSRLRGIADWSQLRGCQAFRDRLGSMTLPSLNGGATPPSRRVLFAHGAPGSGMATALHLFCRQNAINLLDCHISGPMPPNHDWTLTNIVRTHQPCVLLMHRFDTLWNDAYRFDELGKIRDRWASMDRQPLQCWLVWVIGSADTKRIMPLYADEVPPHVPVASQLDEQFGTSHDLAAFARQFLRQVRGLHTIGADVLTYIDDTVCENTHIFNTPGRLVKLLDSAVDYCTTAGDSSLTVEALSRILDVMVQQYRSGLV
jgi:hypothetical protein